MAPRAAPLLVFSLLVLGIFPGKAEEITKMGGRGTMAVGNVLISVCRDAHERPCKFIVDLGASCAFCVCLPVRGCLYP